MSDDRRVGSDGVEGAVRQRYGQAAQERVEKLCCPTRYDARFLKVIPQEIVERDYGCGDPSRYAGPGDVVLDLGSGAGKIAYILSQVVGAEGRVIGVDFHDDMLALARKHRAGVGEKIGWQNVAFRKGRIQDLKLDLDVLEAWQAENPGAAGDPARAQERAESIRREQPLIPDGSVDLIVSNCVLNLVQADEKANLFPEMYRVLRDGGRVAISDIVSDQPVPDRLQADPDLWTGCISGAFEERAFLQAFEGAGFEGVSIAERSADPFAVVEGIDFRSVTVTAHKGKLRRPSETNTEPDETSGCC